MYFCPEEPFSTGLNVPIDTPPEVVDDDETDPAYSVKLKLPGATVNVQGTTVGETVGVIGGAVTVSVTATDRVMFPMLTVTVPV
jgi:hypothetical protein